MLHHNSMEWYCNVIGFISLWIADAIWWHRSGSKLVHVKAQCLLALSLDMNQCRLRIISIHPSAISQRHRMFNNFHAFAKRHWVEQYSVSFACMDYIYIHIPYKMASVAMQIWYSFYMASLVLEIFWQNWINPKVVDGLAPCTTRSTAAIILNVGDKEILVSHENRFLTTHAIPCVEKWCTYNFHSLF